VHPPHAEVHFSMSVPFLGPTGGVPGSSKYTNVIKLVIWLFT